MSGILTINGNLSALRSLLLCLLVAANPPAQAEEATHDETIPYSTDGPVGPDQRWGKPDLLGGSPVSICQLVESAAAANGLPFEFLRLPAPALSCS